MNRINVTGVDSSLETGKHTIKLGEGNSNRHHGTRHGPGSKPRGMGPDKVQGHRQLHVVTGFKHNLVVLCSGHGALRGFGRKSGKGAVAVAAVAMATSSSTPSGSVSGSGTTGGGRVSGVSTEEVFESNNRLTRDLAAMMELVAKLRSEAEQERQQHRAVAETAAEWKAKYVEAFEAKREVERKSSTMLQQWQIQLDEKAREFQQLRQQLLHPRDIELMRVRLLEELEVPHRQKVDALEREIERFRGVYHQLRRQHEMLKTELDFRQNEASSELSRAAEAHDALVHDLQKRLAAAEAMAADSTQAERNKDLVQQTNELQMRVKHLGDEVADVRQRCERAEADRDQIRRLSERQVAEARAALHAVSNDKDTLTRRNAHLTRELEQALATHESLNRAIASLERENLANREMHDETCAASAAEVAAAKEEAVALKRRLDEIISARDAAADTAAAEIARLRSEVEDAQAEAQAAKADTDVAIARALRDEKQRYARLEDQCSKQEATIARLETERADAAEPAETMAARLDSLHAGNDALRAQVTSLTEKLATLRAERSARDSDLDTATAQLADVTAQCHDAQSALRTAQERVREAEFENERLSMQLTHVRRDCAVLEARLSEEQAKHRQALADAASGSSQESRRLQGEVDRLREQGSDLENKLVMASRELEAVQRKLQQRTAQLRHARLQASTAKQDALASIAQAKLRVAAAASAASPDRGGGGSVNVSAMSQEVEQMAELGRQLDDIGLQMRGVVESSS